MYSKLYINAMAHETMFAIVIFEMSSASGGFAPIFPPGLRPRTPKGDLRPPDSLVPPPSIISKHATVQVRLLRRRSRAWRSQGGYTFNPDVGDARTRCTERLQLLRMNYEQLD